MILYHLDTLGRLQEGMLVNLSPASLSVFGRNYVSRFQRHDLLHSLETGTLPRSLASLNSATFREFVVEFHRRHHPEVKKMMRPSRLNSFFATANVDDAVLYAERHDYHGPLRVFEIQVAAATPCFDMTWLDRDFPREINPSVSYYFRKYWAGELFEKDLDVCIEDSRKSLREFLITSPALVRGKAL
ncbi:hypothetical protein PRJ39_06065 [Lysobacter enzymogenes]|uniref:hypothetical protein n=1 Tax=Lysobacter enzymogenes TaxID=69 RepID=UPI0037493627